MPIGTVTQNAKVSATCRSGLSFRSRAAPRTFRALALRARGYTSRRPVGRLGRVPERHPWARLCPGASAAHVEVPDRDSRQSSTVNSRLFSLTGRTAHVSCAGPARARDTSRRPVGRLGRVPERHPWARLCPGASAAHVEVPDGVSRQNSTVNSRLFSLTGRTAHVSCAGPARARDSSRRPVSGLGRVPERHPWARLCPGASAAHVEVPDRDSRQSSTVNSRIVFAHGPHRARSVRWPCAGARLAAAAGRPLGPGARTPPMGTCAPAQAPPMWRCLTATAVRTAP